MSAREIIFEDVPPEAMSTLSKHHRPILYYVVRPCMSTGDRLAGHPWRGGNCPEAYADRAETVDILGSNLPDKQGHTSATPR